VLQSEALKRIQVSKVLAKTQKLEIQYDEKKIADLIKKPKRNTSVEPIDSRLIANHRSSGNKH
jgi:hypothetical protein